MKNILLLVGLLMISNLSIGQKFELAKNKSELSWKGYAELGGFVQEGTIKVEEGSLEILDGVINATEIIVDMKSIKSEDSDLTKHLKQKDFFDVKKFPEARLILISMDELVATANLTIRGITKEVVFPIEAYEQDGNMYVNGTLTIDRTQFEIKYNSSSYFQDLGNYAIKNEFDLRFNLCFQKS